MGADDDLDDLQESSEYDWLVVDTALAAIIGLSIALGETFGQVWKIFEKVVMKYAGSSEAMERSTAVGTIAECIKNMGPTVTPYTTSLLKLLLHRLSDEDPETKSNAAFATGLLCQASKSDQEILKAYNTILGKLEPLLHTQGARLLDNAAGCVSRMIMKHKDRVPTEDVLPALIGLLPLKMDYEENEPIFKMIIQLCESPFSLSRGFAGRIAHIQRKDQSNDATIQGLTQRLVPVLAHVLSPPEEQLTDDVREQLVELVRYLHKQQPALIQGHERLMSVVNS